MKILLLAGTFEARILARDLTRRGHKIVASLAGATRTPAAFECPTRIGGFGGAAPFAAFLRNQGFNTVIDATHPFAHRISSRSWAVCQQLQIPYVQFLRDPWRAGPDDDWIHINAIPQAVHHIAPDQRAFLATGRQTLEEFRCVQHATLICRQIDPPNKPFPLPNGRFLIGRPPFSVMDEMTLFEGLNLDWLVVKNAGGDASRSKLDAAARIGLKVLMIARPASTGAESVARIEDVFHWVDQHADN